MRPTVLGSLSLTCLMLASCGGGGGDAAPANAPPTAIKDVAGLWGAAGDPNNSGSTIGFFLTVGDVGYGVETTGNTRRFFRGTGLAAEGTGFAFSQSRFDKNVAPPSQFSSGLKVTNGKLAGSLSTANELDLSFVTTGAVNDFIPLRLTTGAPNTSIVADLREYAGSFVAQSNTVKIVASSADSGTISAKSFFGCDWSGTITRPRTDKNVWVIRANQSACVDGSRNSAVSEGLATIFTSGSTKGVLLLTLDGSVWTIATVLR